MEPITVQHTYPFLQVGGEMAELTRRFDWSLTSVGSPDEWPQSLRTTVSNLLRSRFPMFLWWGDDMVQFYNDAYRPSLGNNGKHPFALGQNGKECWPEIWDIISPLHHQVRTTGEATWMENQLVPIFRNGKIEDVYWTYSYSSVLDDEGNHGGILVTCMETTDNVLSQKKVEESQQELFLLFEQSPVAIAKISKDDNLVFEFANSFYGVLVGREPKEIIGKALLEALPEIKGQGFDELLKQVIRTGHPFDANEVAVDIRREGKIETIYVDLAYQPRTGKDGSIDGVLAVATDVSKQVRARKIIEESEGRFRLLADASPNLIWMLNPDATYAYVNKTTLDFLNVTQEQIDAVGWEAFQHPRDLDATTQALKKAIQNHQPYQMEHRIRHKSGEYRWVLSQAIPAFDVNGNVFAYVGSSIDIHEAKQYRQELQTALEQVRLSKEAAELGTFDMDLENGTMHWDDRCRTLFGITHHDPVTYEKDFAGGLHPDDRERILKVIDDLFIKSISNGDYDVEYRTVGAEDGVIRWVRAKGKVYFNNDEKPIRFIGSVLDITEQKQFAEELTRQVKERTEELELSKKEMERTALELERYVEELKRSNKNLEEFTYAASHDLKEPIRKIRFFSNRLKEGIQQKLSADENKYFEKMETASRRMVSLIDDLLLYSQVSLQPRVSEQVNLNEILQHVQNDLEVEISQKKAEVISDTLPLIQGHPRQIQQAFFNIISNALKYSKEDVIPRIEVKYYKTSGEAIGMRLSQNELQKTFHSISFTDNGIGFEQEDAERIFNVFTRLHGNAEYKGTGVGLSIVRRVMENHGGYVKAKGSVDNGAIFELFFPY